MEDPIPLSSSTPMEELESIPSHLSPVTTPNPFVLELDYSPSPPRKFVFESSPPKEAQDSLDMMGAGLVNLGNTCFLNAILQCFTHTVPFVESLRSIPHQTPCKGSSEGFCVVCAVRDHVELSLSSSGRAVLPRKLVDNLSYISSSFQRYEQEDAHEFLQCLLDKLDSCSRNYLNPSTQDDSFVNKIFGGRLKSKLQCCNCGHCSNTFEPLIDLSLEIDDVDSLPSALESFTKVEKIEETKFKCDNCKEDVYVEKQFTLEQTPSIASFHLKRFKHDGSYVEKIDKYVEYPLELDLQPYSTNNENSNEELKYDLYAVVVHTGLSSCSGHYFCFIRSSPQIWHRLDDSKVTRVTEEYVLSQEAYILFYARQGTPWFSTLMETQKQHIITSPKSVLVDVGTLKETQKQNVITSPKPVLFDVETLMETPKQHVNTSPKSVDFDVETLMETPKQDVNTSPKPALFDVEALFATPKKCVTTPPKPVVVDIGMCSRLPVEASDFSNNTSRVREATEKNYSAVSLKQFNDDLHKASDAVDVRSQTPPRSPSPDIFSKDSPEDSYITPHDHLKLKNQTFHNRTANKTLEDSKRREAFRLTRTMPSARANKFRACMLGSQSEGSINKKKRKVSDGLSREKRSPSDGGACRKFNPSILSSLAQTL